MLDERLAFLALRIVPADALSLVPGLADAGVLEQDAERELVRLTFEGLRRITPAQPPRLDTAN
jgi:hypothetical protein